MLVVPLCPISSLPNCNLVKGLSVDYTLLGVCGCCESSDFRIYIWFDRLRVVLKLKLKLLHLPPPRINLKRPTIYLLKLLNKFPLKYFTLFPKCLSSMPQVSDFIGENTDICNFNNLNIDFHPI